MKFIKSTIKYKILNQNVTTGINSNGKYRSKECNPRILYIPLFV